MLAHLRISPLAFPPVAALALGLGLLASGCGDDSPSPPPVDEGRRLEPLSCPAGAIEAIHLAGDSVLGGYACVRYGSGQIGCWGDDPVARLFRDAGEEVSEASPHLLPGFGPSSALAVTYAGACAVETEAGAVRCTADLARSSFGLESMPARWPLVEDVTDPEALAVGVQTPGGGMRACAVGRDGSLRCWGHPNVSCFEQPLDVCYSMLYISIPSETVRISERPLRDVVAGGGGPLAEPSHFCALTDEGELLCWGEASTGALGTAEQAANCPDDGKPECENLRSLHPSGVIAVALGEGTTCALLPDEAGRPRRVRCWGSFGEYGASWCPECAAGRPTDVDLDEDVAQLAVGAEHVCVLLSDRTVRCWGSNRAGQLGDGTFDDREPPGVDPGLRNVERIAAGRLTTCAQTDATTVQCWGEASSGLLGRPADRTCRSVRDIDYPCSNEPGPVAGLCEAP